MKNLKTARRRIGFMQGRLSPLVDGKIQAFPVLHWREEFPLAGKLGLSLMEWTLDHEGLAGNPFVTRDGQKEVRELCGQWNIAIPSVTGDCFMQAPFWKAEAGNQACLLDEFRVVLEGCAALGVHLVVVPVVDNGRLENLEQEQILREGLKALEPEMELAEVGVVFESDYAPQALANFMNRFPPSRYGINYDIGNSAALGGNVREEFAAYGGRVLNVHVKDRALGGGTTPLGAGVADFPSVFNELRLSAYSGNLILQTARAADGDHVGAIERYAHMVSGWLREAEFGA